MSSTIISPVNSGIRACAGTGNRNTDPTRRKPATTSPKWWTPLFGISSEADYINDSSDKAQFPPETSRSRIVQGRLTEEKARRLRVLTSESSSFHDVMYHSAIASRMASDFTHFSSEEDV